MSEEAQVPVRAGVSLRAYVGGLYDEIEERVARQRAVVLACLAEPESAGPRRQRELENALRETVQVLEETKRSFKSKRLGELREKLVRVLGGGAWS